MGDSGSLMLGGAIAAVSIFIKQALFVLVGAIFVAELFSTLIQKRYGLKKTTNFIEPPFITHFAPWIV